jgi:hypothetical protein
MAAAIFDDDSRRIVLASEFWFGNTTDGIAHGLRKIGWDVFPVDTQNHFLRGRSFSLRVLSRAVRPISAASYNAAVLDAVEALRPKAFLTVKGLYLSPETLDKIRRRGVMTINYYPDFHFDYPGLEPRTLDLYDRFFTTKSFQLPFLEERLGPSRARFLHHGYSSLVHRPRIEQIEDADFVADCAHVGSYSPWKARWLEAIVRALPEVELIIIGSGWKEHTKNTVLEASVRGHVLLGDFYSRFLQQVRVNLAFHTGTSGRGHWQDLVSTRTFEIPACKGFMLHIDNDEVRTLYEPGREIDVFSTEEQLCDKLVYYLARPAMRKEMIERAYTRCVPAYSYDARAQVVAEVIEGGH